MDGVAGRTVEQIRTIREQMSQRKGPVAPEEMWRLYWDMLRTAFAVEDYAWGVFLAGEKEKQLWARLKALLDEGEGGE